MVEGKAIEGCGKKLALHDSKDWGSWINGRYFFKWEEDLSEGSKNSSWYCGDTPHSIGLYCGTCLRKAGIVKVKYLNHEIEACGRETRESPDSYWFFPKGDANTEYPHEGTHPYLRETGIKGNCGLRWHNLKVCIDCLRRLGVIW